MHKCQYCNALKWKEEAIGMCCGNSKVHIPPFKPLSKPLYSMLLGSHPKCVHFMDHVQVGKYRVNTEMAKAADSQAQGIVTIEDLPRLSTGNGTSGLPCLAAVHQSCKDGQPAICTRQEQGGDRIFLWDGT
ncbi:UNVERIFIED_CONTAM: hypothetical protein K2H54_058143 [Gekko kuhli]